MARRVSIAEIGRLAPRARSGHKGTFGRVVVVGGCCRGTRRYVGAPALSALGALRSGCGLCVIMAPEPVIGHVLRIVPSATGVSLPVRRDGGLSALAVKQVIDACGGRSVLVIGPGLGDGQGVDRLIQRVWAGVESPVVLDADGLNALARMRRITPARGSAGVVLTPHPGEAARLMNSLGITGDPTDSRQRTALTRMLAVRLGCVVALKGAGTVVSDGNQLYINQSGGPNLGTGGTGDVLAGVIAGLAAQENARGVGALFQLTCLGVLAHGRAGDAWAKTSRAHGGMLATELASLVPTEVEKLRGHVTGVR